MDELKPCPFCGSPIANNGCFKSDTGVAYWVRCPLCKAEGPTAIHGTCQAGELWNTRASDEVIRGLVEALEDIIKDAKGYESRSGKTVSWCVMGEKALAHPPSFDA